MMARDTEELDFSQLIDADECKRLIAANVAELAAEHQAWEFHLAHPQPLDEPTRKLFKLGPNATFTTADLAASRVGYLEAAQTRLWDWWKKIHHD